MYTVPFRVIHVRYEVMDLLCQGGVWMVSGLVVCSLSLVLIKRQICRLDES